MIYCDIGFLLLLPPAAAASLVFALVFRKTGMSPAVESSSSSHSTCTLIFACLGLSLFLSVGRPPLE